MGSANASMPVTGLPSSMSPEATPFPMPNSTVPGSGSIAGTGVSTANTTAPVSIVSSIPVSAEPTTSRLPNNTLPGSIAGTGFSSVNVSTSTTGIGYPTPSNLTPFPLPNATMPGSIAGTGISTGGTMVPTPLPFPDATSQGMPSKSVNLTILPISTLSDGNVATYTPTLVPTATPLFPTSNSSVLANTTSLEPDETRTLFQGEEPSPSPMSSLNATLTGSVASAGNATTYLPSSVQTVSPLWPVTAINSTGSPEPTAAPESSVIFPNSTLAQIGTSERSVTATPPTGTASTESSEPPGTLVSVGTFGSNSTITARPASTSPCATITITNGTVTQVVTKTVIAPDESASLVEAWSSNIASITSSKEPCNSTSKAGAPTTCTSTPLWRNSTSSTPMTMTSSSRSASLFNSNMLVSEIIETRK
ncbi:hypothetical protein ACHAQH_004457 [Verticillium albo-atrum]